MVYGPVLLGIKSSSRKLLCWGKAAGGPLLTNKSCCKQAPDPIEQDIPGLYPSCAVTLAIEENVNADVDLSNTVLGKVFENNESNSSKENLCK